MKERITLQKLVQEAWIPVLTGALSAGLILSLQHSAGMAYATALLLLALYFVAIAANRVDFKGITADIIEWALQQARQVAGSAFRIEGWRAFNRNASTPWPMQVAGVKRYVDESKAIIWSLVEHIESMSLRRTGLIGTSDSLKKNKALTKLIQAFKNAT